MESTPFTGPTDAATTEMPPVEAATAVHATLAVSAPGESCSACGAHLAADQRYCVDCGEPCAASRIPALLRDDGGAGPAGAPAPAPAGSTSPVARISANTALIAGIGVLLLAMAVGVFIGSRGTSNDVGSARFPGQVTVVSSGAAGAATPTATATPAAATAKPTAAKGGAAATAPKKTTVKPAAASPAASRPPPNAVHVGSPGSGPGYQNGKFTGNFFGSG